ncbi:MAG: signal peptide peptidase SppA [Candidatus Brocadia sp.]|jgi:protease-4
MTEIQHNNIPQGSECQPAYIKKGKGASFWVAVGLASFFFLCTILLFTLFIGSLVLSKALITSTAAKGRKQVTETVIGGSGESKVAIIPIKGILSNESAEGIFIEKPSIVEVVKQQLEQATDDAHVKAILLEVDSPGGGITASDIIYNQIIKFKAVTQKKVVVYMQDIAASGGYYISSAADAIVAHPTTITGSIGVIMPLINVAELINRYGIKDNSIASGNLKEIGSPLKEMTADEAAILKGIIDEMYMQFVKVVSTGRNLDIEAVKKIADGRIYTGKQAIENGLVDQLGYLEDAITLTKKLAGLTEATVVRYEEHYGLADLFGLMSRKLFQNNTIRLDISQLQEQVNTRPMYLWNGYSKRE